MNDSQCRGFTTEKRRRSSVATWVCSKRSATAITAASTNSSPRSAYVPSSEHAARLYEEAAAELERAVGHCRVAAERYRAVEQPSGAAHALAARGHVLEALARLDENARAQARKSLLPGDEGFS